MHNKFFVFMLLLFILISSNNQSYNTPIGYWALYSPELYCDESKKTDPKDFENFLKKNNYYDAYYLLLRNAANLKPFVRTIEAHTLDLLKDKNFGMKILSFIISRVELSGDSGIVESCINTLKTLDINLLNVLASKNSNLSMLDKAIVALVHHGDAGDLLKGMYYASAKDTCNLPFKLTPSGIHLFNNLWVMQTSLLNEYRNEPELLCLLSQILKKEAELNAGGYYTFIHAQRRGLYFPERVYTLLWQQQKKVTLDNFLFAHVKPILKTEQDLQYEEETRTGLLLRGRIPGDSYTRQKLLFINYGLFAQSNDHGSNSANFIKNNINYGTKPVTITVEDSFACLGYNSVYEKYKKELEEIATGYEQGTYGNVLLIGVPRDAINEYVYLCQAGKGYYSGNGGVKRSLHIEGVGQTDNTQLIMQTLLNSPQKIVDTDDLEFCLIMTQIKGGLDPQTGIVVYPILSGVPKKLEELKTQEAELFKKIIQEIEQSSIDFCIPTTE